MKKTSKSHHSSLSELNITPLLDLVFVLLVIFIITTPQMMNNLEMNLPSGNPPKNKDKPKVNNITVNPNGDTFLNGEYVTMTALREKLQAIEQDDPSPSVVVITHALPCVQTGVHTGPAPLSEPEPDPSDVVVESAPTVASLPSVVASPLPGPPSRATDASMPAPATVASGGSTTGALEWPAGGGAVIVSPVTSGGSAQ